MAIVNSKPPGRKPIARIEAGLLSFGTLMQQHFLIVRKDVWQSAVVGFWLAGASEAYFSGFSGCGYADALGAYRRLFFTVVIIEDLILVAVDIETDLREVNLIAKIV